MAIQVFPTFFRGFSWRRRCFLGEDDKKSKLFTADLLSHDHICIFCRLLLKNVVFATVQRRQISGEDNFFSHFVGFSTLFVLISIVRCQNIWLITILIVLDLLIFVFKKNDWLSYDRLNYDWSWLTELEHRLSQREKTHSFYSSFSWYTSSLSSEHQKYCYIWKDSSQITNQTQYNTKQKLQNSFSFSAAATTWKISSRWGRKLIELNIYFWCLISEVFIVCNQHIFHGWISCNVVCFLLEMFV